MKEIILLFFLAFCSTLSASTYYVSPNGLDSNPGTKDKPWKTWGKAFNSGSYGSSPIINPGDTVYFRGGVYYKDIAEGADWWYYPNRSEQGTGYEISRDGTLGNYIHYFAYPNEIPILDCYNAYHETNRLCWGIYSSNVNYVHLKGLHVRNVRQIAGRDMAVYGIQLSGNDLIIENCTVYSIWGAGFRIGASVGGNAYIVNCDAHNCCDSLSSASPGNDGYGFSVIESAGNTYFSGCRAWNCGDDGFNAGILEDKYKTQYSEYYNCWSFKNGMLDGGGTGFKMGWISYTDGNLKRTYKNCIAAFNRWNGWKTNDYYANRMAIYCNIYNCTSYHNGYFPNFDVSYPGYGFEIHDTDNPDENELKRILKNNISFDNQNGAIITIKSALYTHDHNSWDIPLTLTDADFVSLDSTGLAGPRQADGSLPDLKGFLKLKATSKAVDAGINVGLPFIGFAPDLGAYEFDPQQGTNKPPAIAITLPSGGSTFTAPANISISANASDADGTVTKVEFFRGTVKLGEKTSAPWSYTWSNVAEGTYSLTAVASDNLNAKTTSAAVTITANKSTPVVNQPPAISITTPLTDSKFTGPADISIAADVSDSDGLITKVEFFSGTVKLGENTTGPWTFAWNNVTSGTYSLTAVATDNLSAKTTSSAVSVTVIIPPVIAISSPVSGSTFTAPAAVTITANASDANVTISKVEFFNGAVKLGEKSSDPWSLEWNNVPVGTYSLIALATDNSGEKTTSAPVTITVNTLPPVINQPPVIDITYPSPRSIFEIPVNITIEADVTDSDGTIKKVEFYNGSKKLGETTSVPWSLVWNNLPAGTHSLTAVATDNLDARTASQAVKITVSEPPPIVNTPPVVSIVSPSKGQIFKNYSDIMLDAIASDPDGTISKVEFYSGNKKLAEISTAPYSFTWKYIAEGIYSITAVATDNLNSSTYSSPVWLEVEAESEINILSEDFNLYPNPNDGNFSLVLLQPLQDEKHIIRIVTLDGRTIYTESFIREEILKQFYLSHIMSGTYILVLLNSREIVNTKKFIKY